MNYSCTIVILLLLQASLASFANECHKYYQTRFKPCHCTYIKFELRIYCVNKNMSAIYDMFDRISPQKLNMGLLYIRDNEETKLGENLLKGTRVNQVVLRMPRLKYIDADFLKGQGSNMKYVHIIQTDLEDIPNAVIKKLEYLKVFEFNGAKKVRAVVSNSFKGFAGSFRLTKINYAKNSISFLDYNAFGHLETMESINLAYNKLKFIDQSSFPNFYPTGLPNTLLLAYNNLRDLPLDFLSALNTNTYINLVGNKVKYLSREFMRRLIKKHITIDLAKNQLKCGCSMMTVALANKNDLSHQFNGACATPSKLNHLPLANLTYEHFPSCSEDPDDMVTVMRSGFQQGSYFAELNDGEMDKIESTADELDNTYNV